MKNLIARCEQLLLRHIDFLVAAPEALQVPAPSLLRIMKVSCMDMCGQPSYRSTVLVFTE